MPETLEDLFAVVRQEVAEAVENGADEQVVAKFAYFSGMLDAYHRILEIHEQDGEVLRALMDMFLEELQAQHDKLEIGDMSPYTRNIC